MGFVYRLDFSNGKSYVGITTKTIAHRFYHHQYAAKNGIGGNRLVYNAWRKYGKPKIIKLFEAPDEELSKEEIRLISEYRTLAPNGYNLTAGGEATLGYKHTEESRRKMSMAHIGIAHPNKGRPSPHRGRKLSEEQKIKIAKALTGVAHPPERAQKAAKSRQETYDRRKAAGVIHPRVGLTHSKETREKISEANRKRKMSPEHRAALSAGARAYHAAKRLRNANTVCV